MKYIIILLLLSTSLVAQDTLRFEIFSHYIEVDKTTLSNEVKFITNEPRTGYIILTTEEIIIVDQHGTTIEYKVYSRRDLSYYLLDEEDYAYFLQTKSGTLFSVRTKHKNYHYTIVKES